MPEYDPEDYRKCTTCLARTGELCVSQSRRVAGGRPDGVRAVLPLPHVGRAMRKRRIRR